MSAKTVLVAEDDMFLAETIVESLREHDVHVLHVLDGEAAIATIDKNQPDLLLLDLVMPKKDGIAVLKHVHEKKYAFPVIILSNLGGDLDPAKCFELGARDYLVKSDMDDSDLWPRLKKYL